MVMITEKPSINLLGRGIYTVKEAAWYARVTPQMAGRWVFGSKKGDAVIEAEYSDRDDRLVSFIDFVQLVAIREIQLQENIPLSKFRQAIRTAKVEYGLDHPFARDHCTLFGDQFVIVPPGKKKEFMEASGPYRGQKLFPFVETYLKNLSYSKDGLANKYRIFMAGSVPIEMNPQIRFGEPILPSKYSASIIWDAIRSEGTIEGAARSYGISSDEVKACYDFMNYLGKKAA